MLMAIDEHCPRLRTLRVQDKGSLEKAQDHLRSTGVLSPLNMVVVDDEY